MDREFRAILGGEVRVTEDADKRLFAARICNYNVRDDHDTEWAPGVFTDSLRAKNPVAVWSHDWRRPFGKVVEHRDAEDGIDMIGEFADFDAVPDAKMVHALLKGGIVEQFSFGFVRTDGSRPGQKTRITKAQIDEISPVLVGSIPGTKTLAVRSSVDVARSTADDLLERVSRGDITAAEALEELANTRSAPLLEIRSTDSDTLAIARETFSDYEFEDISEDDSVVGIRASEAKHKYLPSDGEGSVCKTCGYKHKDKTRSAEPDAEVVAAMAQLDSLMRRGDR